MLLYKFLSSSVFDSVIKSNILWFSQIEKANDKRERYVDISNDIDVSQEKFLCLCKSFKNAAMWYHYANKHDGVCIEFDFQEGRAFKPVKIEYLDPNIPDERERLSKRDTCPRKYLSIKSFEWRYEDEIRIFCDTNNKSLFKLADDKNRDEAEGVRNILDYIQNVYIGDNFSYNNMSQVTASFLKKKYDCNMLKILSKPNGFIEKVLNCNSPRLLDLFNHYKLNNEQESN